MTTEYVEPPNNNKLYIIIIALGTLLALGIIGVSIWLIWGGDDNTTPLPTPTSTTQPSPLPGPKPSIEPQPTDQHFVNAIEQHFSQDFNDNELVQLGLQTCETIDIDGWDEFVNTDIQLIANQLNIPAEDYAFIAGASIAVYCDRYLPNIE